MLLDFVLAALTQTRLVQLWHIYVLSFLLGTVNALDLPAQQAFLGDLTGMAEVRKAVNLNVTLVQVSRILGPALAGSLVARIGVAPAFWLNGLSFLAVIASLIVVRAAQQQARPHADTGQFKQIVEGVGYLRGDPRMVDVFLLAILQTVFVFSIIINFLPSVASTLLNGNAETLGLIMASSGLGALLAVVVIVPLAQARKRNAVIMLATQFWLAFWLTLFAHARVVGLSMAALFMVSVGATMVLTMTMGLVQLMSPQAMRGRLISLFVVTTIGAQPLAALWIGQLGQLMGVETAIQINAILLAVGAVAMLAFRSAILRHEYGHATPVQLVNNAVAVESREEIPNRIAERAHADEAAAS
jgi:MFS family permease